MKIKDILTNIILIVAIVLLVGVIGFLGYNMYKMLIGDQDISLGIGDAGYPEIGYSNSKQEKDENSSNDVIFTGVESGNSTSTDIQNRYRNLYSQLDENAKIIYNKLYANKENLKTGTYKIEFGETFSKLLGTTYGSEDLQSSYQSAIEALVYENPEIFYIDATKMYINIEKTTKITGVKYNVYINQGKNSTYLSDGFYGKESIDASIQEIEKVKKQILQEVSGKSDYESIRIIHDYLVDNIEYESTISKNNIYNIYGALVMKECVCEGYAKAFQYLMNEIGIDNALIIGDATNSNNETENHAWNYVKLNGRWYAVDTTWDDPVIIGGGTLTAKSRYQYFLRGESVMNKNHIASGKFSTNGQLFTYPTLSSGDYN